MRRLNCSCIFLGRDDIGHEQMRLFLESSRRDAACCQYDGGSGGQTALLIDVCILSAGQFARLDRYEWGGVAYRHLELDVAAYDGRRVRARVYSARYVSREKSPSCRYLTLIREGARVSGLDDDYVRMLDRHPCRDTPTLSNASIGLLERSARLRTLFMFLILGTWKARDLFTPSGRRSNPPTSANP